MSENTHICPAPGCGARIAFDLFACKNHWYRVSPANRGRLWREYRNNFGERSYFEARANCLRDLGVPEDAIAGLNGGIV